MLAGKAHCILLGIARDAGLHGGEEQLQKRGDDGALALLHGARTNLAGQHLHIVQARGATGGQALAHGVEVVHQLQAQAIARQHERHRPVLFVQRHGADPVGVQRARAVVLAAADAKVLAIGHDACADRAIGAAHLPACVAQHGAVQVAREPALAFLLCTAMVGGQQPFDEGKARAQGLGHIGVHRGHPQQQADHVAHRAAGATVGERDAHGIEPCSGQLAYGVIRQLALTFTLGCTGRNLGKQGIQALMQVRNAGQCVLGGVFGDFGQMRHGRLLGRLKTLRQIR